MGSGHEHHFSVCAGSRRATPTAPLGQGLRLPALFGIRRRRQLVGESVDERDGVSVDVIRKLEQGRRLTASIGT